MVVNTCTGPKLRFYFAVKLNWTELYLELLPMFCPHHLKNTRRRNISNTFHFNAVQNNNTAIYSLSNKDIVEHISNFSQEVSFIKVEYV